MALMVIDIYQANMAKKTMTTITTNTQGERWENTFEYDPDVVSIPTIFSSTPMKRIKILARKKLNMSPGKLAAQSVHAALALAAIEQLHSMMSVVVLMVNETPFNEAKDQPKVAVIADAGYTEVDPGTETVLAYLEDDPRDY